MNIKSFLCGYSGWIALLFLLICQPCKAQQSSGADPHAMENRFFAIDLSDSTVEMGQVKNHFFTTFPHDDPTRGDVVYDRRKWDDSAMFQLKHGDGLYLFIKAREDETAFDAFRLTSKAYFNLNEQTPQILFVFKGKLPSAMGLWPAWWLNGSKQRPWLYQESAAIPTDDDLDAYSGKGHFYNTPSPVNPTDWPAAGEIDIIETINGDNIIHNTIHTCPQMCNSEWNNDGKIINCANATATDPNSGCSGTPYRLDSPEGTFACLWEGQRIRFYYWSPQENVRGAGGPLSDDPDPDSWQKSNLKNEVRLLETDAECSNELHQHWQCENCAESPTCSFVNMKMIFNATLCGKWAGSQFDGSENSNENCRKFVLGEGREAIHNQYLKIEYVAVKKL